MARNTGSRTEFRNAYIPNHNVRGPRAGHGCSRTDGARDLVIIVQRICKAQYPGNNGEGARLRGGRWNHKVAAMIYRGRTVSLCALEVLVNSAGLPSNLVVIQAAIPKTVRGKDLRISALPPDWKSTVPGKATKDLGTKWARSMETAV